MTMARVVAEVPIIDLSDLSDLLNAVDGLCESLEDAADFLADLGDPRTPLPPTGPAALTRSVSLASTLLHAVQEHGGTADGIREGWTDAGVFGDDDDDQGEGVSAAEAGATRPSSARTGGGPQSTPST